LTPDEEKRLEKAMLEIMGLDPDEVPTGEVPSDVRSMPAQVRDGSGR
jgi:hypothetical protein